MFQTLVDVASRRHHIWQTLLGHRYTEPLASHYWALSERVVLGCFEQLSRTGEFMTVKQIFARGFAVLFREAGLELDPQWAAQVAAREHALAHPYNDALPFLEAATAVYPVCLVCDGDEDMLPEAILAMADFDRVFLSERLRAYKAAPDGQLFAAAVAHYNLPPERILHIGDSAADVAGAQRAGMRACWLNRTGATWAARSHVPDFTVTTLDAAAELVGLHLPGD
jgi:putative hydrolase of the HAD superfamily